MTLSNMFRPAHLLQIFPTPLLLRAFPLGHLTGPATPHRTLIARALVSQGTLGETVSNDIFPDAHLSSILRFSPLSLMYQARNCSKPSTTLTLSLIHISEPTRQAEISYAVFCLKKKK